VCFRGQTKSQILAQFPDFEVPESVTEEGWFFNDILETDEEALDRANSIWAILSDMSKTEEFAGKTIAIVTHGMFLDFLMGAIMNRPIRGTPRFAFFNTGYSLIEF
jgi:broad specificity phosphatase PhoE